MLSYTIYGDTKQPKELVFLLHGYGSNKGDFITLAPDFAVYLPNALFISPNAPENLENNGYHIEGYQWFSLNERIESKIYEGANKAAIVLEEFIKQQLKRFFVPFANIVLIGFSQGAMMSLHLGLRLEKQIGGIIGYSGLLIAPSKLKDEIKSKPPVMLIHGAMDNIVPISEMEKAHKVLNDNEVISYTYSCNGLGHGIDTQGIQIGGSFLNRIFNR